MSKRELTKMPLGKGTTQRWRKKHKGQIFYFSGTYQAALEEWRLKLAELAQAEPEPYSTSRKPPETFNRKAYANMRAQGYELSWNKPQDARIAGEIKTVADAVDEFLLRQRVKMRGGQISCGRCEILRRCVEHFRDHVGGKTPIDTLNGRQLESYHSALLEHVGGGWSKPYASRYMGIAKQFLRWADGMELLPRLPRNIDSKDLAIGNPQGKIRPFSNPELKTILQAAPDRTRLYILLMLNCGYTQADISDLEQEQVQDGRITRKRSKTKSCEGVPTVSYKLWPETLALLEKYRSADPLRVLLNMDGKPLRVERIKEDGKYTKTDNIATAYFRLCRGTLEQKHPKPLKMLRKTSPSRLEGSGEYASCARWFLGHAPRGVADRNYIAPPQDLFDKAVEWLREQYDLAAALAAPEETEETEESKTERTKT